MSIQRDRLHQLLDEVLDHALGLDVAETKSRRHELSSVASVSALPVAATGPTAATAPGAACPRAPGASLHTFAVIYAENSDVVATYESRDEALAKLATFVKRYPARRDEIGLRPYEVGRPAGPWRSAAELGLGA